MQADAEELDDFLWQTLWKPVNLPRDVRQQFRIEGEQIELVAHARGQIIGGLIAIWTSKDDVELHHLTVRPDAQNKGTGRRLVTALFEMVVVGGCRRIHTIARNTSSEFLRRLGFRIVVEIAPEHPDFKKHGIILELMERNSEAADSGEVLQSV